MPAPLPKAGDRIRVTGLMPEDPAPLEIWARGTVTAIHPEVGQIHVGWDNGRTLILLTTDPFELLTPGGETP